MLNCQTLNAFHQRFVIKAWMFTRILAITGGLAITGSKRRRTHIRKKKKTVFADSIILIENPMELINS